MRFMISAAVAAMAAASASAAPVTLTFDEGTYSVLSLSPIGNFYSVQGFEFVTSGVIEDGVVKSRPTEENGQIFFAVSQVPPNSFLISGFDLRGSGDVDVYTSSGVPFATVAATSAFQTFGPFTARDVFSLSADADFDIDNLTIDFSPTAVPEPASWALMISGFGLAGAAARRVRTRDAGTRRAAPRTAPRQPR